MKAKLLNWFKRKFLNTLEIKVKRLHSDAIMPTRAYQDDAGTDLYATEDVYIETHDKKLVGCGLAFEIPSGWHMQIHTRSSYSKRNLRCHLGIIDAGYRDEVKIMIFNDGMEDQIIKKGEKFCQLIFLPVPKIDFIESDILNESDRGQKGFGSSDKKSGIIRVRLHYKGKGKPLPYPDDREGK